MAGLTAVSPLIFSKNKAGEELVTGTLLLRKIRSYGDPQPCKLIDVNETTVTVEFDQPQFAPCSSQRLILYNSDDNIVAGGTISGETAA